MKTVLVVGTLSPLKCEAVRETLLKLDLETNIVCMATRSGVPDQPVGMPETRLGARNRAFQAHRIDGWAIGIENGIVMSEDGWVDLAVLILVDPVGNAYEALSGPVAFPEEDVRRFLSERAGGTVGKLIAERTGCDHADPHAHLTEGRHCRKDILIEALVPLLAHMKENS